MKRRNRKSKVILIIVLILFISIGYSVLTTTLNITGNSEIKSAKWDIHFDNLVVDSSSVEATTPAVIDANKTTINYGVHLVKPGDSYSFTVDVVNEGTIDGMISTVTNTGLTEEQQKYIVYSTTYNDGTQLQEKDGLKAGTTKNIKVSVKYKDDINPEDLPQEEATINLTFNVVYVQADDTANFPTAPVMKSYTSNSTEDYHAYKNRVTKIVTKTNIDVPETAIEHWDVSAEGDNSVIAYIENDGSGAYKVTIGANGKKVIANEDSSYLFHNFTGLREIDLSNFDTSNVTDMQFMFAYCSSLVNINLNSFDTSKVTNMEAMFYNCSSLTSLDLSNFNTINATIMSSLFAGCQSLINLDVSSFDTSNVTSMYGMFSYCWGLKSLDLSSFDTSKVIIMNYMFYNCRSLTSLDLSTFDTSKVTGMNNMFAGSEVLRSLTLNVMNESFNFNNIGISTYNNSGIVLNYTSVTQEKVQNIVGEVGNESIVKVGILVTSELVKPVGGVKS